MPPGTSKGAGGARGSKASAAKRTVKGKKRAAQRRPPARLLARRSSPPKTTIERRAEAAGRKRPLLRGALAVAAVAALSAGAFSLFSDRSMEGAAPLAQAERAAQPEVPEVTPAPASPVAASLAAASVSTAQEPQAAPQPAVARRVAPAAPPPEAADEPESAPAPETAAVEVPVAEVETAEQPAAQKQVALPLDALAAEADAKLDPEFPVAAVLEAKPEPPAEAALAPEPASYPAPAPSVEAAAAPAPIEESAQVALAADLLPQDLPEVAAPTDEPAESPLPETARQALNEVDSLAADVETVLVEPVRLSELLPSSLQAGELRVGELVINGDTPLEAAPPVELPLKAAEPAPPSAAPAVALELAPTVEALEDGLAPEPLVELVELPLEELAEEPPSILAETALADPLPAAPLASELAALEAAAGAAPRAETAPQLAGITPARRPSDVQRTEEMLAAMRLPIRRPGELQVALLPSLPVEPAAKDKARWQTYAVPTQPNHRGDPMIALVIDDLGLNRPKTWRTIELPAPLTLAFLTYATGLPEMTAAARARGHELMVHIPMQPLDPRKDPGTNALAVQETRERVASRLDWGLSRFEGYVGINNHMGSRFTAWPAGMEVVMREVRRRGLLFVDSLTTYDSVGGALAERFDVPYALRDIFLDNEAEDARAIRRQLDKLETLALEKGYAVGIGHPYTETLNVLSDWLPRVQGRGIRVVPISAVVRHRSELAAKTE